MFKNFTSSQISSLINLGFNLDRTKYQFKKDDLAGSFIVSIANSEKTYILSTRTAKTNKTETYENFETLIKELTSGQ